MLASAPSTFAYYASNYASTPVANIPGTGFTAGANGADAAAVSVLSALSFDAWGIRIRVASTQVNSNDGNSAGDVLIDPAGGTSWSEHISDLVCGYANGVIGVWTTYEFPLFIRAGTSIGWRCKTQHTADITTGFVLMEAWGGPSRPELEWCGSGVETVGISDNKGTAITAGNSGAAGTWTSVGSTTTRHWRAVQLGINGSDASASSVLYHYEMGYDSAKVPGSGIQHMQMQSTEVANRTWPGPTKCNIPVGTQMQARGTCSGTAEVMHMAIYGVY